MEALPSCFHDSQSPAWFYKIPDLPQLINFPHSPWNCCSLSPSSTGICLDSKCSFLPGYYAAPLFISYFLSPTIVPSLSSLCTFSSTFWDPTGRGETECDISTLIPVGNWQRNNKNLMGWMTDLRMGNGTWGSAERAIGKRDWKEENRDERKENERQRFRRATKQEEN